MKLLFFKAPWCTVSHAIESTVPSYAVHIDCDEDQETPTKYGVLGLPLFVATDNEGNEIARMQTTNIKVVDYWFNLLEEKNGGKK